MVGVELDIDEVGVRSADLDHLVGRGAQSGDIGINHLYRPAQADPEPHEPGMGVVPDQLLRRDVEAVEFHGMAPILCRLIGQVRSGKGSSLNSAFLAPKPPASSVYVRVLEAHFPFKRSIFVMSLVPSPWMFLPQ